MKTNAVEALTRGRLMSVKASNAIGFEQDTVHPDSKSVVVRKLVPKLANKVEKFRHRNQLSATFLTHLDKFAVHKPPKSAAATTSDGDASQTPIFKDKARPTTAPTTLPKL